MFVDTKGVIKSYRTDNTMVKRKRTKGQTMIYKFYTEMLRRSLFVLFRLTIVLSVLWLLLTPLVSSKHVILSVLFGHCVCCSSPIDGFCLPLWYLQTLLI